MGQVVGVVAAVGVFVALLVIGEIGARRWKVDPESSRRLVHLSSGVVAAGLPAFLSFPAVVVLALVFIPFLAASRRMGLFPAVHEVERATWGEVYFPLGVLLAAALFPDPVPYAYGVLVMGVSDPVAGFAGHHYGRRGHRLLATGKTNLGSTAFFATTLVVTLGAVALTVGLSALSVVVIPALAVTLTVVEGMCGGGADNVVLPVVGAALLSLAT